MARGASIGLYVGILLGAYVVYVVPSMEPDPYDSPLVSQNWGLAPILSDEGSLDGAQVQMQLLSFYDARLSKYQDMILINDDLRYQIYWRSAKFDTISSKHSKANTQYKNV